MTKPRDPRDDWRRYASRPEGDEGDYLAIPDARRTYFPGTTTPALATRYVQRDDGLLLPESALRAPQPIDLIRTYITFTEVFGTPPPDGYLLAGLHGVRRADLINACAYLLGAYEKLGASRSDIDAKLSRGWFKEPAIGRIEELLRTGSTLVAPQTLLLLMQLAILRPADEPEPGAPALPLPGLILALQESLGTDGEGHEGVFTGDPHSGLFREIVASHHFGQTQDMAMTIAHHQHRWVDLAQQHGAGPGSADLQGAFRDATGVDKDDFAAVGLAIWAYCETHDAYPIAASALDSFRIPRATVERALSLMAASREQLSQELARLPESMRSEWSFDVLGRYPLLRQPNGDILVLSKELLVKRLYGWLPLFDIREGLRNAGRAAEADRATDWFRHLCELDAVTSLRAIAGTRLFEAPAIQRAFGTGHPNADAAVEYPDAWVVIEIGTRQLTRATVVARDPEALEIDLQRGIDQKVLQLDSTIGDLMTDEGRLTGRQALPRRRYVAVLVLTEGFPVNPMTTAAIRGRLARENLLVDPRIGPLHVIDQEELDMVEAIGQDGGPSLLDLLEAHEHSSLGTASLKDWIILERERGSGPGHPYRLDQAFRLAWQPAAARLRDAGETE